MLNEADTCTRHIVPRLREAGWDSASHSFNEQQLVQFTDGRIVMAGNRVRRRPPKRADYLLKYTRGALKVFQKLEPVAQAHDAQSAAELEALLPSILDRAFMGQLWYCL